MGLSIDHQTICFYNSESRRKERSGQVGEMGMMERRRRKWIKVDFKKEREGRKTKGQVLFSIKITQE